MLACGTTCFETKCGYGLAREQELRALGLAGALGELVPQTTLSTALLAHAVPDGFSSAQWMGEVEAMMAEVIDLGTVSALDIFVEPIAFSTDDLRTMGELARAAGMMLRVHGEQFERQGTVPVALEAGARSIDHLSVASESDVRSWPTPSARRCCCPRRSSSAPSTGRRDARWPTPVRSSCWPAT